MKEINYEFTELDSDCSFSLFGKSFGGILKNQTFHFDNDLGKGELTRLEPDNGLWVRKWNLSTYQKIILHKLPSAPAAERKIGLIYLLNPGIFQLKNGRKNIPCNSHNNNLIYTNSARLNFSVIPRQPFYAIDIAFTESWLLHQFSAVLDPYKESINLFLKKCKEIVLMHPCVIEDYKILHELEVNIITEKDPLFIRSRIYNLIANFFHKYFNGVKENKVQCYIQYEKIMKLGKIITENLNKTPKIKTIAKEINMSPSSMMRQFKLIYGKGIHEYHTESKMEHAKKMLYEQKITVKAIAKTLGYKQTSHFINCFIKHHGFTPGKMIRTPFANNKNYQS